jgi:hypothetical protein
MAILYVLCQLDPEISHSDSNRMKAQATVIDLFFEVFV